MGYYDPFDAMGVLSALELLDAGFKLEPGAAVAAQKALVGRVR